MPVIVTDVPMAPRIGFSLRVVAAAEDGNARADTDTRQIITSKEMVRGFRSDPFNLLSS